MAKYVKPPKKVLEKKAPKILFMDIETTPVEALVWDIWNQNIGLSQIIKDWSILSWAAKWRGSKSIMYDDVRSCKDKRDDKRVCKTMWRLLDEADVVVGQNSKRFDEKKLNARFVYHGMEEPSPFQSVDTLQIAKSRFKFTSNRLEYLAKYLGVGQKYTQRPVGYNGMDLWVKCLAGDSRAFEVMEKYNKGDISPTLEGVWEKLSPWARGVNYINPNLYVVNWDADGLPVDHVCQCGSGEFVRNGYTVTNSGRYLRWKCRSCGANHREKGKGKNLSPQKRTRV